MPCLEKNHLKTSAHRLNNRYVDLSIDPLNLHILLLSILSNDIKNDLWRVYNRENLKNKIHVPMGRGRDRWEDQAVDGRIILRWIFRKWEAGTGWNWLRIGTGGGRL